MDATNVEDPIHHRIATINLWEDPRRKKQTMHPEDIEEDIKEIIMVKILAIGVIVNLTIKMKTETQTLHKRQRMILLRISSVISKPKSNKDKRIIKLRFKTLKQSLVGFLITNLQDPQHVNAVFTRSGKTYDPRANPNTKTVVFLDDSEDKAEEVKKEAEPLPKKPIQTDTPPLKAYKPKIPYPQRLNKEQMEARYAKFFDMIKEVRINVPLVDVLAGMPNYGMFLKDLIPPKLGDPRSFLISCKLANSVEYLALADLGASINLMPYSLYAALSEITLKPTRMSILLANHTYQYPMGVAENMLVQVGKFVFPVDFVILLMEEDDSVPLILGRPFLHTADAIIRVKNNELNLGIGEDRATVHIDKAM
ncbi:reverse transcriptase domain-containing protein [Tanacetum coccineum]